MSDRITRLAVVVAAVLAGAGLQAQSATQSRTRAHVEALASEKLEGRMAGSVGERMAGEYIARELVRIGAKPLPGAKDLFQSFDFSAGGKDAGSALTVTRGSESVRF